MTSNESRHNESRHNESRAHASRATRQEPHVKSHASRAMSQEPCFTRPRKKKRKTNLIVLTKPSEKCLGERKRKEETNTDDVFLYPPPPAGSEKKTVRLANRNKKSQGEFQKKDATKRVPQAQEIDNSRKITTKKGLLEAQTKTSRSASSSSFISLLFQNHSFSDRIFKTKNSVSFLETHCI